MRARILIADDHVVVRQGLRDILAPHPDLEVVGEAADGFEAERLAEALSPDLLLLDLAMPGRRGIAVLESLRARGIGTAVVFFSMYPPSQYVDYIRRAGGQGFVGKDAEAAVVVAALRRVLAGESVFPPAAHQEPALEKPFGSLSARETAVLRGLLDGTPASKIAVGLGISAKSVGTYRRRLLDKLGLTNNAEMIALAIRHGML